MAVNDIYRVGIQQTLHGQMLLTILHYRMINMADPATHQSGIAERVESAIVPLMKAVQSAELWHDGVYSQKIWPLPPLVPSTRTAGAGAGGVAGQSLPTSVAVTITKMTQYAGPKYRGRVFMGGVPATSEADSQLAQPQVASWQALADMIATPLEAFSENRWEPVLWHHGTKTYDTLTAGKVRLVMRNQRRRQVGKGQ